MLVALLSGGAFWVVLIGDREKSEERWEWMGRRCWLLCTFIGLTTYCGLFRHDLPHLAWVLGTCQADHSYLDGT